MIDDIDTTIGCKTSTKEMYDLIRGENFKNSDVFLKKLLANYVSNKHIKTNFSKKVIDFCNNVNDKGLRGV